MYLLQLFEKIGSVGENSQHKFLQATQIRTLNQQAFIVAVMCFYFVIASIGKTDIFIAIFAFFATGLIIYLNHLKRYQLAAIYWTIIYPCMVVNMSYFYGEAMRMDYVYTHFIVSVLFFLQGYRLKYLAIAIIFIAFLLSLYIIGNTTPPFAHEVLWFDKIIMFGVAIFCTSHIFLAILKGYNKYFKENQKKQESLENLNNELAKKANSLEKINVYLQRQAHLASHDLKTPLRTISGFTSLLKKESFKKNGTIDESKLEEYHQHVQDGVSAMNQIIEEYIENSREGVGKAKS